jgi:hypothetical protein
VATYQAMASTSQAIASLLNAAAGGSEFDGVEVRLARGQDLLKPMTEGLSLYLHRIVVSTEHRNRRPRTGSDGVRRRPAVPLELHYLLTAWAAGAIKQQRLLGWAIRVLADTPTLPAALLNDAGPEHDVFTPDETVELLLEPLSIQDMSYLQETVGGRREASATFLARVIELESIDPAPLEKLVQTREFQLDTIAAP